ncbi:MAG TPA: twin-arginine translocase TatA/TatE family subunit [Acidimicrobiales bacterium]|nr:twin-arginine translocase TatA/TatE family subunit [Acidimicrobiales bacterium]
MLSLSPAKLLVILVIALIVLGPEKLPQVARQLGAAWHDLRGWRSKIESEVRGTFPNLPPTHEVAQAVRSPFAFLDRLADEHERAAADGADGATDPVAAGATGPPDGAPGADGAPAASGAAAENRSTNGSAAENGSVASGSVANGSAATGAAGTATGPAAASGAAGAAGPGAFPAVPDDPSMN